MYDDEAIRPGVDPGTTTPPQAGSTGSDRTVSSEAATAADPYVTAPRDADSRGTAQGSFGGAHAESSAWVPVGGPAGSFPGQPGAPVGMPPQGYPGVPPPRLPDAPVPWLAGLLGLIPGVGAMYNGQFAKGLAHLTVFAVLVSLADNVHGIFGLFVAGWVFYQAFEAFHTAQARRDGLPLPNAFGLNDIGERLGFGRNWPGSSSRTAADPTQGTPAWQAPAYTPPSTYPVEQGFPPAAPNPTSTGPYGSASYAANWAGYVPPTAFASAPSSAANPAGSGTTAPAAKWSSASYSPTYSEPPVPSELNAAPSSQGMPGRRFPVGAILLIGLGGVFLLSNIAPAWHLNERWLPPLLLLASAIWIFVRRVRVSSNDLLSVRSGQQAGNLICALRLPAMLLVLALMFAFQATGWLTIGQSWPLLLIVLGALLLAERTLGRMSQANNPVLPFSGAVTVPPVENVRPGGDR